MAVSYLDLVSFFYYSGIAKFLKSDEIAIAHAIMWKWNCLRRPAGEFPIWNAEIMRISGCGKVQNINHKRRQLIHNCRIGEDALFAYVSGGTRRPGRYSIKTDYDGLKRISMKIDPPSQSININNKEINNKEKPKEKSIDNVLTEIQKRTASMWYPQEGPQLDNYNEFIERFGEDKAIAAINKSLDTKATLKGAGLIGYAFQVAMNNNDLQPKTLPRKKPHEELITEFAGRLENVYAFFNVYDHDLYPAIDKLMAFHNEAKVIELMAKAKAQNLSFDSFDWIAGQMEGQP